MTKKFVAFFLPILKADFYMTNKYIYRSRLNKISCDVSVLSGENDRTVSRDNLTEWNKVTDKKVHFYSFRGGHFFVNEYMTDIVKIIVNCI